MPYPASYYAATRAYADTYPPLAGQEAVHTCVIGGGLAGLSAALALAEQGVQVALLEAEEVGYGASGRNGGQVIQDYACGMETLERAVGERQAADLWRWSREAVDLVEQRVQRYGIDCGWQRGYATVAVKPRHMDGLLQWRETAARRYGYQGYRVWDGAEVRRHIASTRYCGALYDEDSGHLHPLNYTLGLAAAAAGAGVRIFGQTPASAVSRSGGKWDIVTPQGRVQAEHLVVAVNTFSGSLNEPELDARRRRYILPVGTYIIATEPLGAAADELIRGGFAVCDTRYVLDYYRKSADGRLLFGGKVNYRRAEPDEAVLRSSMRRDMLKVFPQLEAARIDFVWGGRVDISMNRAPDFRRPVPNLYLVQGFSGHGVALTGLAGQVVAEAVLGDDARLRVFESIGHRAFPGGVFRQPAQMLGLAWHRLLDML